MERIIAQEVPEGHYTADICLIWCFDARFSPLLDEFSKQFSHVDLVKVAGGAKGIADREDSVGQDFLLRQIEGSIKLHQTKTVGLMVHANCGAYGKSFPSKEEEAAFYGGELGKAKSVVEQFLASQNMKADVECYLADFKGLSRI